MRSFHENVLVTLGQVPAAITTATVPATYIDMSDYARIVFIIHVGDMPATSTLDAQVVQATDSSGTGSKNITGAAITQLVATDDDKMVSIEVRDTALDVANGFRYVAITLTAANSPVGTCFALQYRGGGLPPTQPAAYEEQVEVS